MWLVRPVVKVFDFNRRMVCLDECTFDSPSVIVLKATKNLDHDQKHSHHSIITIIITSWYFWYHEYYVLEMTKKWLFLLVHPPTAWIFHWQVLSQKAHVFIFNIIKTSLCSLENNGNEKEYIVITTTNSLHIQLLFEGAMLSNTSYIKINSPLIFHTIFSFFLPHLLPMLCSIFLLNRSRHLIV